MCVRVCVRERESEREMGSCVVIVLDTQVIPARLNTAHKALIRLATLRIRL